MKKIFTVLVAALLAAGVMAQAPEKMSYQAVIRNSSNALLQNTQIGIQISILQGSPSGTLVYSETQTPTTNHNGLISIEIGGGSGFSSIDWASDTYFLKTETDPTGGTNYTITGTSQLLSVPYALHAKSAEMLSTPPSETDPVFTAWDKSSGISITESQISDLGNYLETETQSLQSVLTQNNSAGNNSITNLANPLNPQDAATKAYVDSLKMLVLDWQAELGVTDARDGIHYSAVRIGEQVWMSENLRYLPSVVAPTTLSLTAAHYYVYGYSGTSVTDAKLNANYSTYGVLYNWPAAMSGAASSTTNPSHVRGVCPTGWHLPSVAEWTELTDFLGGITTASGPLKETGTSHWTTPNTGATNTTGFTALPGGMVGGSGSFLSQYNNAYWWTSSEQAATVNANYRGMAYSSSSVTENVYSKRNGLSVRCIKD